MVEDWYTYDAKRSINLLVLEDLTLKNFENYAFVGVMLYLKH